jgi:hypothetical protein
MRHAADCMQDVSSVRCTLQHPGGRACRSHAQSARDSDGHSHFGPFPLSPILHVGHSRLGHSRFSAPRSRLGVPDRRTSASARRASPTRSRACCAPGQCCRYVPPAHVNAPIPLGVSMSTTPCSTLPRATQRSTCRRRNLKAYREFLCLCLCICLCLCMDTAPPCAIVRSSVPRALFLLCSVPSPT